jgi:hypothetical protein
MTKQSKFIIDEEGVPPGFEALVLEELENVMFQVRSLPKPRRHTCLLDLSLFLSNNYVLQNVCISIDWH